MFLQISKLVFVLHVALLCECFCLFTCTIKNIDTNSEKRNSIFSWYNRFGNNVIQIIKAFAYAKKQNALLSIPEHPSSLLSNIANHVFSFGENPLEPSLYFWEHVTLKEQLTALKDDILPLITWPLIDKETLKQSIVIHMRNGDIWDTHGKKAWATPEYFNKGYIQPPIEFYQSILTKHADLNSVVIIMDHNGTQNPVLPDLLLLLKKLKKTIILHPTTSIEEDFTSLVFASNVLIHAQSSLSQVAGLMNFLMTDNSIQYTFKFIQYTSPEEHEFFASNEQTDALINGYNKRVKVLLIGGEFGKQAVRLKLLNGHEWLTSRQKVMDLYHKPTPAIIYSQTK